ncbi:hypothetical protein GCM10022276_11190 [Sphingomonas limnosediminicola]|jgi:predicted RNA-binding protein YlxR (DUF448 family)|uniref:YlxR domain-containing protein n=1 Tax=Sphingomonas limnosediminicola TaxID=940133 RepID=A0ABP7L3L7_9SPHN
MRNPRNDPLSSGNNAAASASLATSEADADAHTPERTCVLTRRKGTKDELIRLALSPDGQVAPDVRARAPGRGAWIGVSRSELDEANKKGKLKGALQRAFKVDAVDVPADLGERIEQALRQTTLDRLGMEARSGNLLNGYDRIETAARGGKVRLLLHAADAGEDGNRGLDQAWRVGGGESAGMIFPEGRTILSMALGRENVVHVALTDPAAASRVQHALARWRAFTGPDRGLEGGEPAFGTGSAEKI